MTDLRTELERRADEEAQAARDKMIDYSKLPFVQKLNEQKEQIETLQREKDDLEKKVEFNRAVASTRAADINRMDREIMATHDQLLNLSNVLWEKFYQEASPDFELLDRTDLAVSQIDNMVAGIIEKLERQTDAGNSVTVRLNTCERDYRRLRDTNKELQAKCERMEAVVEMFKSVKDGNGSGLVFRDRYQIAYEALTALEETGGDSARTDEV